MISTFTPCLNFITGSTGNGGSPPTQSCCDSLQSLMSTSIDCACLVINANVPVQLPISQTLSLGLLQACNMGGVPIQCKASGSPLPGPGPKILGAPSHFLLRLLRLLPPTSFWQSSTRLQDPKILGPPALSPLAASPLSPRASEQTAFAPPPSDELATPPEESEAPTTPTRIRPVFTPPSSTSASLPPYTSPPAILLLVLGILICQRKLELELLGCARPEQYCNARATLEGSSGKPLW
ncbi:hypothetical protein Patl1_03335 [Pistacia atlantica]|uniref:Uncharacterized protein n=1 Tax=Pistacia atlantica TaxID=434234 RepID=A0ACC1C7S3_9ROSI|nr:hypothetical protein Patl1_03335 [Pistacia atlantica]